jgi:hypothetical protein
MDLMDHQMITKLHKNYAAFYVIKIDKKYNFNINDHKDSNII